MNTESLLKRLPLMDGSLHDLPVPLQDHPAWSAALVPALARPQLGQELEELVRFAVQEDLLLLPVGTASSGVFGATPVAGRAALAVDPGHVALWSGVRETDRTAWVPAGWTVAEAEERIGAEGFGLALWPEDGGTMGANWVLPRGSFPVREFLHPASRRIGAEALIPGRGWLRVQGAPRSAAGPGLGRAGHGFGGSTSLVSQVLVTVRPLGEPWSASGADLDPLAALDALQALTFEDRAPQAVRLDVAEGRASLRVHHERRNDWDARTCEALRRRLGLQAEGPPVRPQPGRRGAFSRPVRWSELRARLAAGASGAWIGAFPDGMFELLEMPAATPAWWSDTLAATRGRGVLPRVGTEAS